MCLRYVCARGADTTAGGGAPPADDVNRLIAIHGRLQQEMRNLCAYMDEHFLSRATPIRPLLMKLPSVAHVPARELAERQDAQKLPSGDALYELVRIIWGEKPLNHFDRMRFLAIRLMILTGLRINEITHLPEVCIRTELLTDAATGAPAGSVGGVSQVMYLRDFA